jgi:hypothetical protein
MSSTDRVLRILVADALGALSKLLGVALRPPVAQVPRAVELPSLVVEAVRELVADRAAGVAVVRGVVHLRVVERRLQDARGKLMSFICAS